MRCPECDDGRLVEYEKVYISDCQAVGKFTAVRCTACAFWTWSSQARKQIAHIDDVFKNGGTVWPR